MPVNITGVEKTLKAMRSFDPELNRQMNKQIKAVMIPIRDKARGYAPANGTMLSNWTSAGGSDATINYRAFPKYDQNETQKGIVYSAANNKRLSSGFQVSHYVANRSAGGAIYETAGRVHPNGRSQSHTVASRHKINKILSVSSGTRSDMNSNNPKAGQQFLRPLGQVYGQRGGRDPKFGNTNEQGRMIFRAWAEDQGRATHAINLAIQIAVNTFNAKIKSQVTLAA